MNNVQNGGLHMRQRQEGVVLLVVLMLLLLTTVVGFEVMETSSLESRMAVAREGKEISFQAAESIIDQNKSDLALASGAYFAAIDSTARPERSFATVLNDPDMSGELEARFVADFDAIGWELGTQVGVLYELRVEAGRGDDRFDSIHTQGLARLAPNLAE